MNDLAELCSSESVQLWDRQIRLFAKYFLANVALPANQPFKLLDVGCGTGSALTEIRKQVALAELHGCDIEKLHVDLARHMNPEVTKFYQANIADISEKYDFVYASNILEHIHNWKECLIQLCALAPTVLVLVPYLEDLTEQAPTGVEHVDHVNSYDKNSFSFLLNSGFSVKSRVIRTPYAWGTPIIRELSQKFQRIRQGERYQIRREIIFIITRCDNHNKNSIRAYFRNRIDAIYRSIVVARKEKNVLGIEA